MTLTRSRTWALVWFAAAIACSIAAYAKFGLGPIIWQGVMLTITGSQVVRPARLHLGPTGFTISSGLPFSKLQSVRWELCSEFSRARGSTTFRRLDIMGSYVQIGSRAFGCSPEELTAIMNEWRIRHT